MSRGARLMDLGGLLVEDELDRILDKLTGETTLGDEPYLPFAEEFRLIERRGDGYIQGHPLGVVSEDYALRKAEDLRASAAGVAVQKRPVIRGAWAPVELPSQG